MVSGSFRAFDRRPPESQLHENRVDGSGGAANPSQVAAVNTSSSSDTSYSAKGDFSAGPSGAGLLSAANWLLNDVVQIQEPLWDWGQLNWP